MLSICVTVKNRTIYASHGVIRPLFMQCITVCAAALRKGPKAELIVSDWGSTDRPPLAWLPDALSGIPLTIIHLPGDAPFSRGKGLNVAAAWAQYSSIFFIDADMLFSSNVLWKAVNHTLAGKAYFPICWNYTDPEQTQGRWRTNGHGIVSVSRSLYDAAGHWDEYQQWGSEDLHFWQRVSKLAPVVRENEPELQHQWHAPVTTTNTKGNV